MKLNPFVKWFENPTPPLPPEPSPTPLKETKMGIVTPEILIQFAPALKNDAAKLADILNASSINTKLRLAHFLAQAGHESGLFTIVTENLNYSADALGSVFKKYFPTAELRQQYARKPEKIANRVYANRMGNGPETSGDGWKYRGRGYFQLTGKDNYRKYSLYAYNDDRVVNSPDLVTQPIDAIKTAIWYWENNNLNKWADKDDVLSVSRVVNIGNAASTATPHGMDDRKAKLVKAKKLLGI